MDVQCILRVCLLIILTHEVVCRKKSRDRSHHKSDITETSIETLREAKFRDRRRLYVNDVTDYACLPDNTDRLVYRYENKTHIFVGFDNLEDQTLTEMTWRKRDHKSKILDRRTVVTLRPSHTRKRRKSMKTSVILAATNIRQEALFRDNMDSCETSVTERFCLIQVFADMANKLKTVKFHQDCYKTVI